MKRNGDPRIRLMARGAFPIYDWMDVNQVESHREKWIKSVESLGANWSILRDPESIRKGVILLPVQRAAQ
jgi:hypothetical protein